MKGITFSTDVGILTIEDNISSGRLAEEYFGMNTDSNQIPASMENVKWINKNIPDCVNVIKNDGKIIGFTFIVPGNKKIMNDFLDEKINENELFEMVKSNISYDNFYTIYLCSAFIKNEFRRKNLALNGFIKSIDKLLGKVKKKPILFIWAYTKEGERLGEKIAKITKLKLKKKN